MQREKERKRKREVEREREKAWRVHFPGLVGLVFNEQSWMDLSQTLANLPGKLCREQSLAAAASFLPQGRPISRRPVSKLCDDWMRAQAKESKLFIIIRGWISLRLPCPENDRRDGYRERERERNTGEWRTDRKRQKDIGLVIYH